MDQKIDDFGPMKKMYWDFMRQISEKNFDAKDLPTEQQMLERQGDKPEADRLTPAQIAWFMQFMLNQGGMKQTKWGKDQEERIRSKGQEDAGYKELGIGNIRK